MRCVYTHEHLVFLRAGYRRMTASDLTLAFNKKFGMSRTETSIKSALTNHRITSGRIAGVPKGTYRLFNKAQVKFIKRNYRQLSLVDLHVAMNIKFALQITIQQLRSFVNNHGLQSGRTGQFEQGHQPWNNGTKGQGLTGANRNSFKKGHVPPNRKLLGTERICTRDGFVLIKVAETDPYTGFPTRYRHKHVWVWEQEHGPVPAGMVVMLIDSDKTNCELENLTMVSRAELLYLNRHGYQDLPMELRPSMLALAKLATKAGEVQRKRI